MNAKDYGFEVEKTLRLLSTLFPIHSNKNKPTLFHSVRVGTALYAQGYGREIVLAGYLHDVIEDTHLTEADLVAEYGSLTASLVAANSKDMRINDPWDRRKELILRAVSHSQAAAIVKAADILDNHSYYTTLADTDGLDYCRFNARTMLDHLPSGYLDRIFAKLHSGVILSEQLQSVK